MTIDPSPSGPRPITPDEVLFGPDPRRVATDQRVTEADVLKAKVVLDSLVAAGKKPYNMDLENAKFIWAITLKPYVLAELTEAAQEFIDAPGTEFPSVGDVEAVARFIVTERAREERASTAITDRRCGTCDDVRYIRVYEDGVVLTDDGFPKDPMGAAHHMEPCPDPRHTDMMRRRDLYDQGHWDPEHVARGACSACRDYHPSLRWMTKRKVRARA